MSWLISHPAFVETSLSPLRLTLMSLASGAALTACWLRLFDNQSPSTSILARRLAWWTAISILVALALPAFDLPARGPSLGVWPTSPPLPWIFLLTLILCHLWLQRFSPSNFQTRVGGFLALLILLLATSVAAGTGGPPSDPPRIRPETTWVGALALASSASLGLALAQLRLPASAFLAQPPSSLPLRVRHLLGWTLLLQLGLLALGCLSLGPMADLAFSAGWLPRALPLAYLPLGLVAPQLSLLAPARWSWTGPLAAALVLAGGLLFRLILHDLPPPLLALPR